MVRWSWLCVLTLLSALPASAADFDLLIQNGKIVDGSGTPWYYGDLAIQGGRISAIGRLDPKRAERVLDARGMIVAPGFIDMMGQTGSPFLKNPGAALNLLTQGITTINAGEGASAAPLNGEAARSAGWSSMAEYFALLDAAGLPVNVVQTVGHTQVRALVLGDADRRPQPRELEKMKEHVREAMQAGAIGVSTALIYPPAVYASTDEIAELARVAGEFGGGYYTHMRNEGERLLEAIDEALEIGAAAKTRVHIFHLKAAGSQNWPKYSEAIARIQKARAAGQQVAADVYPYINNGLGIKAFIHPRHAAEGAAALRKRLDDPAIRTQIRSEMEQGTDFENWYRHVEGDWNRVMLGALRGEPYEKLNGRSLQAIADELKLDPWDVFFEAARRDAFAMPQTMSEENLKMAMREEFVSFCTDVGPAEGARIGVHPRAFGSFPRILSRYVTELKVLTLERAVCQMSAVAANELTLYDRGRLVPGQAADVVIFDPAQITDRATFAEPHRVSEGMRYVIVNGRVVLEGGKYTGARPGKVLRGPGWVKPK